jgi:hypothetical protein
MPFIALLILILCLVSYLYAVFHHPGRSELRSEAAGAKPTNLRHLNLLDNIFYYRITLHGSTVLYYT